MKDYFTKLIILLLLGALTTHIQGQTNADRTVSFSVFDAGEDKPIIWGLDMAWRSESNIRRGIAFMGSNNVDLVRSSFTPTSPLVNGQLQSQELAWINERLGILDLFGRNMDLVLNSDHPNVDASFVGNAANWAQLIDVTASLHEARGHTIVTVSPFNEPDYTATGQGTIDDFYAIAGELRQNSHFDNVRISGGNTLNNDQALVWYNPLKDRLDEGNTHQLAGTFGNYATFYETVRSNGHHATNDELHNVMEAMVGVEYGMQTGIWWGTAELARGEFVKASDGKRLAYAEHRPNWTAASVYRTLEGKVQAFGGASERQATTTTYRFVSEDMDVFFDGHGPQREYMMVIPGGTGYLIDQPNAERMVNITWGDDIQPVINGQYMLVNRNSGKVIEVASGSDLAGANLQQGTYTGADYQKWDVTPVDSRVGGDFSYFTLTAVHSGKSPDVYDYSLDNGGNIVVWDDVKSSNQQWYLDYHEDGWFYIRNRHSSYCLAVDSGSTGEGANVVQWEKNNNTEQQWRFLPVGAAVEFVAPSVPVNLVATENSNSIQLNWSANTEADISGYTVFRSQTSGGPFNTIARNVTTTSYNDNKTTAGVQYFYVVKAVDYSLNSSSYSNETNGITSSNQELIAHLAFDANTLDNTVNLNHGTAVGGTTFVNGQVGSESIALNGTDAYVQLPSTLVNHQEITIAAWVYWNGGSAWQRIFDFGNSQSEYLFLSPSSGSNELRFAIANGSGEQVLNASPLPMGQWSHVAVTLSSSGASMYLNGSLVDQSSDVTISPLDFQPVLNYIGLSQFPDPLFNGNIDDFRVYNYALGVDDIAELVGSLEENCFTQVYLEETNLITDPSIDNANNFVGWGTRGVQTDFTYCGPNAGYAGNGTGISSGSLDHVLSGSLLPNTAYRIRAYSYVPEGTCQIGLWGIGTVGSFEYSTTKNNEWELMDFVINVATDANLTDQGAYFNNYQETANVGYIDNWEIYAVPDYEASAYNISLSSGNLSTIFDSETLTYTAIIAAGTTSITPTITTIDPAATVTGTGAVDISSGSGTSVITVTARDGSSQKVYTLNYYLSNTVYQLRNRSTGMYLDGLGRVNNGDNCGQSINAAVNDTQWEMSDTGDNYFQLKNVSTGLFLDGMGLTTNGVACGQYANTNDPNSHWAIEQFEADYYIIQNRGTGLYLDGMGRTINGDDVGQSSSISNQNSQWELITTTASARIIRHGEESLNEDVKVSVYPNPVTDILNITFDGEDLDVDILDMSGRVLTSIHLSDSKGTLDLRALKAGVYMISLRSRYKTNNYRIIKN